MKKMHKPNDIVVLSRVMLPRAGSEYAKHIETTKRRQNYVLMELHLGMMGQVETVNKNDFKGFTETRQFLGIFIVFLQSLFLPIQSHYRNRSGVINLSFQDIRMSL